MRCCIVHQPHQLRHRAFGANQPGKVVCELRELTDQQTAEPIVVQKLEELGLPAQVKTAVRIVPSLSPDPVTGKFRRIISRITPPPGKTAA